MKRLLGHVSLTLAVTLTFAACARQTETPPAEETEAVEEVTQPTEAMETEQPVEEEAFDPEKVDWSKCVRIAGHASTGEAVTMDPMMINGTEDVLVSNPIYNSLWAVTDDFQVQPELAKSWESNADATEWTVHLQEGVLFHDGHEFTSADVVYTYQRLIDPERGVGAGKSLAKFLTPEGIVAADPYTVKFVLEEPVVELPLMLSIKEARVVPDGARTEDLKVHGVGTGPFIPYRVEPLNWPHRFVRNPDYWEEGLPKADCLEITPIVEATARTAALMSGEIDVVQLIDYSTVWALQALPDINLLETGTSQLYTMEMWVDTPPFDDPKVRKALKMVVDKQAIIETALQGFGEIGDDNPISPTWPAAYRPTSDIPARDVGGAIALLEEAGYNASNPLKVDLFCAEFISGAMKMCELYREQAAEAGVEVNIVVAPVVGYWSDTWLKQPFVAVTWNIRPPFEGLTLPFLSNATYNSTHWFREDFDSLLGEAAVTVDEEERTAMYQHAAEMLTEEGGQILPMFSHMIAAVRANCSGFKPHVQIHRFDTRNLQCEK